MLHEASCSKRFIPIKEFREVLSEQEVSTLIKLLRDVHIIVSRKEYCDTIRHVRAALNIPGDEDDILAADTDSDDEIIALNPAVIDEMRKSRPGELSYHMVRSFVSELLGSLELAANVGSLNDLVKELSSKYETKFKTAVTKDIIMSHACNLSEVERVSLTAAKLASPPRFNGIVSILLSRARRLAEQISLELTEEDIECFILYSNVKSSARNHDASLDSLEKSMNK